MNTFVDFNIAKLLKDRGIKIEVDEVHFYEDEINNTREHQLKNREVLYQDFDTEYPLNKYQYQTYTISDIIMWLYEKYGIWVSVSPVFEYNDGREDYLTFQGFQYYIVITVNNKHTVSIADREVEATPAKSYLSAIEYILNKVLIFPR